MRRRLATTLGALVALAILVLAVSEAAMASTSGDRSTLYTVFGTAVVCAGLLGWALTKLHRRLPSLRWTILSVAIAAVVVASAVAAASTSAMFLAPAELQVVLAALLLGAGLGVILAVSVTGWLTGDLEQLATAARRVADGDLTTRTDLERRDEVGALAASLDRMVEQLSRLETQRIRDEAARRRLLASIGHDLRTPLASLQAAIEALEDGVAPDPSRYLRSMGGDVALLGGMVDDLFMLAQLDAGELPLERLPVELGELVDGAAETLAALAARHGVTVDTHVDAPLTVTADAHALDRVVRNLLDNAIRHAPQESIVRIEVSRDEGHACLRVHDEGQGFPADFAPRAFERFSRADEARGRQGGGAGLGLAIARQLVEAHGGTIRIGNGPGATVHVVLPLAPRPSTHTGS